MKKEKPVFAISFITLVFVMLVVFFGVLTPQVPAAEKTMVVSGHPEYPPFMWREGDAIEGVGPDIFQLLSQELGIRIETPYLGNWEEVQNKARLGEIDGLVALYYSEERSQYYEYSIPFAEDPVAIFVLSGHEFPFVNWETLIGKKGVSTLGDIYGEEFDTFAEENLTIERLKTVEECFQKLIDKEAEYFVFALYPGLYAASLYNVSDQILPLSPYVSVVQWHIAISLKSPFVSLMPQIDAILKKLIEDQTIENLVSLHSQKWGKDWQL